jgi:hypothetical protein
VGSEKRTRLEGDFSFGVVVADLLTGGAQDQARGRLHGFPEIRVSVKNQCRR